MYAVALGFKHQFTRPIARNHAQHRLEPCGVLGSQVALPEIVNFLTERGQKARIKGQMMLTRHQMLEQHRFGQ